MTIFAAAGSARFAEWVSVQAPEKRTSRKQPLKPVPKLVIVAVPVTYTDSASAVARSVVDAEAIVEDASALVERRMADTARM